MIVYLLRRVLYAVPIALAVSIVCFLLVHLAPGDPVNAIVSADAPADVVEQVRRAYGLDRPLPVQFWLWLGHVVQGDFGQSLASGRPVWEEMSGAIVNTLRLSLVAAGLGFAMGSLLGVLAAARRNTRIDKLVVGLAAASVSVPHYWLGMVMVVISSVRLNLLPALGAGAERRQQVQPHAGDHHHDHAEPVVRHRHAGSGQADHQFVDPGVAACRSQHAQQAAHGETQSCRDQRQAQRVDDRAGHLLPDGTAAGQGLSEVALHHVSEPQPELHGQGAVEAVGAAHLLHDIGGGIGRDDGVHRVARCEMHQQEADDADRQCDRHGVEHASKKVDDHAASSSV